MVKIFLEFSLLSFGYLRVWPKKVHHEGHRETRRRKIFNKYFVPLRVLRGRKNSAKIA
jgi:hypothetical protein